ncbi:nucleoid-associated protein Lsr2 [Nocardia nova]|uniref:Nucleoid-associated protein Lsr2 n=1 Tax=Nocardia nova TaxID=37330 RepID=A0A2S6AKU7_9NOCA|nr:Lsr2 family protein [Nocardia nova]PPJ35855.1 nucleoid-associated protein Lsr2 [Nocardia nova]
MAKKVIVELVDDYDGKSVADGTVYFGIDGVEYEIDLSAKNAQKLRGQFEQWVQSARKVSRNTKRRSKPSETRIPTSKERTAAIRQWARDNGYEVSSRGRIHKDVVAAYNKVS